MTQREIGCRFALDRRHDRVQVDGRPADVKYIAEPRAAIAEDTS
jgi:hypothetical protein